MDAKHGCLLLAAWTSALPGCADEQCSASACDVRARPFLIGGTASPTLGEMVLFQTDGAAAYTPIEFAADVVSDDGGEEVDECVLDPSFVPCPLSGSSATSYCDGL